MCFYFWLFHVKGHVKLALIIKKITIYWEAFFENVYLNVNIFLFKIVFSSQPSDEESSSDDTSHEPSPALRRRRNRKKTVSISESEEPPLAEPGDEASKEPNKRPSSGGLNKCVILALVIAVSMGFGHFYGKCLDTPCADATYFIAARQDGTQKGQCWLLWPICSYFTQEAERICLSSLTLV